MANTSVTYTGDNVLTTFAIPFPYLEASDIIVEVNSFAVLSPASWYFSGSGIKFRTPPGDGASVKIYRQTEGDTRIVDFQNGAVLTEADLDLSANQLFYLVQEAKENLTDLINAELIRIGSANGVVSTDAEEIIAGLVETILADATALNLSQRVQDIDDNASSILNVSTTLQSQINALAQATAATVFVQAAEPVPGVGGVPDPIPDGARWYDSDDNNHPYIYDQGAVLWVDLEDPRVAQNQSDVTALDVRLTTEEGLSTGVASSISALNATVYDVGSGVVANADAITALTATVGTNTSSIVTEQNARASGDSAIASDVTLIGAANVADTAFILNSATVKIDSDGGDTIATRLSALSAADGTNAADITTEESARISADTVIADELHLLGAKNGAATAFILDTATVKLDSDVGQTVAAKFSSLVAATDVNTASITSEQSARISADGVLAADVALMGARNGAQTAFILDTSTVKIDSDVGDTVAARLTALAATDSANSASITTIQNVTIPGVASDVTALEARYGVLLDVNGYVTGFVQNNDGSTGNFVIMANNFAIQEPGVGVGAGTIPFSVSGGVVTMQNVVISGSLVVNGTITSDELTGTKLSDLYNDMGAITAGSIVLNSSGYIRGGQTAYNTGAGFFLGYDTAAYKFSIGNPSTGNYLTWDGSALTIKGDVFVGVYAASDTLMLSADTERTSMNYPTYEEKKVFTVDRAGSVRVYWEYKCPSADYTSARIVIKKNGSIVDTSIYTATASYTADSYDVTGLVADDEISIELRGGQTFTDAPENTTLYIQNARIKGTVSIPADGGTVQTN